MIGVIKETVPQDEESIAKDEFGLKVFQSTYFNYPLYLDQNKQFYKSMGYRKLYNLFSWNPFTWYSSLVEMYNRAANKGIAGNMVGEGIVLGGVLLISKTKGVIYQYNEQAGLPVPIHDITNAIKQYNESNDPNSVPSMTTSTIGNEVRDTAVCVKKEQCVE